MIVEEPWTFLRWVREAVAENSFFEDDDLRLLRFFMIRPFQEEKQQDRDKEHGRSKCLMSWHSYIKYMYCANDVNRRLKEGPQEALRV